MTEPTDNPFTLTSDEARTLAGDLLRVLTERIGDPDAISACLLRWLDVLDVADLSLVCMAAVHMTFTDCLTLTATEDVPPGALALTPPAQEAR